MPIVTTNKNNGGIGMKTRTHGLDEREMELVKLLMAECKSTGDVQAKLKKLFAGTIEQMLEVEMDEHLGYEKNSVEGNNSGNSRNGYGKKTISSDYGDCEIAVPRDRNGEFEPKVIEKRQTRTDEIEQKIMSMYAKGMSQRDIEDTLREIYGSDISQGMISKITDRILPEVNEWQNRPLDKIYPVIFFMGFIPSDSVEIKSQKENFDYRKSIARGECIACGDDVIAYDVVENYILSLEKNLGVRVMYVGYDPWNAASTVQKLENADDPIRCSDIIQHSRFLHPATKLLEEKILNREFFYEENFLLENNFENARCVYDTNLNKYINKKKSNGKVDMLAALINAVFLLIEYEYLNKRVGCVII